MRVVLRLADGSEAVHEVEGLTLALVEWEPEVTPGDSALRVGLHVPGKVEGFCGFVVHHQWANTMDVEPRPIERQPSTLAGEAGSGGSAK